MAMTTIPPPPLPPKIKVLPRGFAARQYAYEAFPQVAKANYYSVIAKHKAPKVLHWVIVVVVTLLILVSFLIIGPNIYDTPLVVAGKLQTINIWITFGVVLNVLIVIIKCIRRPIPRGLGSN